MFETLRKALTPKPTRWSPPPSMNREGRQRHIDDEAAFRAHLMRHTHYR